MPIRAVLNRLSDPAFLASVESVPVWSLLRDSLRAVQILPALINAERQALGLSQMELAVEDRREHAWADRIATDPQATHLAVELLQYLARPAEGGSNSAGLPACNHAVDVESVLRSGGT